MSPPRSEGLKRTRGERTWRKTYDGLATDGRGVVRPLTIFEQQLLADLEEWRGADLEGRTPAYDRDRYRAAMVAAECFLDPGSTRTDEAARMDARRVLMEALG